MGNNTKFERYTRIATFIFIECAKNSESGNWVVDFEEIENFFGFKFTKEIYDKVEEALFKNFKNAVLDNEGSFENKCFDIMLGTDFVINNGETAEDYGEPSNSEEEFEFEAEA